MSKPKQIITIVTTAIVFLFIGIIAGGTTSQVSVGGNTFQDGWKAAEKRLAETGFAPMADMEVKSVNGEIQEINNSKITLKIQPLSPLADKELDTRTIEVANAKIYQTVEKNQEEFQKEMEEFNKKMQAQMENLEMTTEATLPPQMFIKKEIKLSDLKTGQQIMVATEEDIKETKQFAAKEITLQLSPVMPEGMSEILPPLSADPLVE